MSGPTTIHLQRCLIALENRDPEARAELLGFAHRRLRLLAKRMYHRFPKLYSREQSDDLFQEAMLRLWTSLETIGPTTVAQFMGLATLQMQRALCDLARRHFGRTNERSATGPQRRASTVAGMTAVAVALDDLANAPDEMVCWSEFHAAAGRLADPYRTAFALSFYHGLSQPEVADVMNVSVRQVQRYCNAARLKLARMMQGAWPEL